MARHSCLSTRAPRLSKKIIITNTPPRAAADAPTDPAQLSPLPPPSCSTRVPFVSFIISDRENTPSTVSYFFNGIPEIQTSRFLWALCAIIATKNFDSPRNYFSRGRSFFDLLCLTPPRFTQYFMLNIKWRKLYFYLIPSRLIK